MCVQCENPEVQPSISRRRFVASAAAIMTTMAIPTAWARQPRSLSFYHTHTGERLQITYAESGRYVSTALKEISHFLRDFRTGDEHPIAPDLLDTLYALRERTGGGGTYEIISAFRSPRTNEMLRGASTGVAERSLHMEGRAIDVRLRGVRTARLREEALAMQVGGVGYYPGSDFVHVDNGRVRFW
jgi:uncharacterized protein YcbK (DUF882 family)